MKAKIRGFDWDAGNTEKCRKHGVSTQEAERVFVSETLRVMPDIKHSLVEDRFIAVASVNGRYIFVVFTWRGDFIRPVSARYMHQDELEYYERRTD